MALLTSYVSQQPVDDFSLVFATLKYSATLAATTDTTLTIPGDAAKYKALIKVSAQTWVAVNAAASVPAGASFAPTASEGISPNYPVCREVKGGDVLHFFAPSASGVSVSLYVALDK